MNTYFGTVDQHDLRYVTERYGAPLAARPAPVKNGRPNPMVTRFLLRNGNLLDVTHIKPVYYEKRDRSWHPLSEVTSYHGNKRIDLTDWRSLSPSYLVWLSKRQNLLGRALGIASPFARYIGTPLHTLIEGNIGLTTSTFNPNADAETTSVDGNVSHLTGVASWSTVHDAASGTEAGPSATGQYFRTSVIGGNYYIDRMFFLFDTSTLPDGDTISSATLSLRNIITPVNPDSVSSCVVQTSPASNTDLTTADYDQCGTVSSPTEGASRIGFGSWSSSAYTDTSLNATGISWVSKTSITKLGLRVSKDCDNSAPSGHNYLNISFVEVTGTSDDPKLTVEHSSGSATANLRMLMGIGT